MRTSVTTLLALLALAGAARAATDATREDLAFAYVEFEAAYAANPPAAERLAEVNRTFDRVTMLFFSGRGGETIKGLAELTASLRGETSPAGALARSVSVRVAPRVLVAGAKEPPVVAFDRFYEVAAPPEGAPPLAVVVVGANGRRLATGLAPTGSAPLPAEVCALPPGLYEIRIGAPDGVEVVRGRFAVVPRPLAEVRPRTTPPSRRSRPCPRPSRRPSTPSRPATPSSRTSRRRRSPPSSSPTPRSSRRTSPPRSRP